VITAILRRCAITQVLASPYPSPADLSSPTNHQLTMWAPPPLPCFINCLAFLSDSLRLVRKLKLIRTGSSFACTDQSLVSTVVWLIVMNKFSIMLSCAWLGIGMEIFLSTCLWNLSLFVRKRNIHPGNSGPSSTDKLCLNFENGIHIMFDSSLYGFNFNLSEV
jgi:hypothetical protein